MKKTILALVLGCAFSSANAWEFVADADEDGAFLNVFCENDEESVEVVFPFGDVDEVDGSLLFQIDGRSEFLVSGFWDNLDAETSVFVGVDRRNKPALTTEQLIRESKAGQFIYLGDPDLNEAMERWPLKGFSAAMRQIEKNCT